MKVAYFDCQFGAAGDMLNAALLAAGADEAAWRSALARLPLPKVELRLSQVERCNLIATKLDVLDEHGESFDAPSDHHHDHASSDHHHDDAPSDHHHDHAPGDHHHHHAPSDHHHHHAPTEHHHGLEHSHSHLPEILQLIDHADLTPGATSLAKRIFSRLADAEAKVHGVPAEQVAFHEVGAVDSIIDIVGFSIAYDSLQIEKSFGSAVAVGSGTVKTQHGLFPVPGPATFYLLENARMPMASSSIGFECLTPTGAAILAEVVSQWGKQPELTTVGRVGYGAGTKNPPTWPNVCRVVIGESGATMGGARFAAEALSVIEANIDDFSPQALSTVMERLLGAGAMDVTLTPVVMKKGRAGHILSVLCKPEDRYRLQEQILDETSSIGVRWYAAERLVAHREWQEVELSPGRRVRIKIARDNQGHIVNMQPEFEDCARYADEHKVPVKEVLIDALSRYRNGSNK